MNRFLQAVAVAACTAIASPAFAVVNSLSHTGNALDSVTVDGFTHQVGDLIGVDLTAFNGGTSVLLTQNGVAVPAAGSRATLIEDNRLDTGVINPDSGAMTATVNFLSAVRNQNGTDIILLEYDPSNENGNDDLQVTINGITKLYANSEGVALTGGVAADVHSGTTGAVDTLAELESTGFNKTSDTTQVIFGYSIDLSDFGLALDQTVTAMSFGSNGTTIDPVFIAGVVTPEPATALLGVMGVAGLAMRRRKAC